MNAFGVMVQPGSGLNRRPENRVTDGQVTRCADKGRVSGFGKAQLPRLLLDSDPTAKLNQSMALAGPEIREMWLEKFLIRSVSRLTPVDHGFLNNAPERGRTGRPKGGGKWQTEMTSFWVK
jgi:hypothetical protein